MYVCNVILHVALVVLMCCIYKALLAILVITLDIRNGVTLVSFHRTFPQIRIVFANEACFFCHVQLLYYNIFIEKSLKFSLTFSQN
jgi:hypothetical protein